MISINYYYASIRKLFYFKECEKKSGQATYIAPLQPPILALFPAWGSSEGAGRIRLARCKIRIIF